MGHFKELASELDIIAMSLFYSTERKVELPKKIAETKLPYEQQVYILKKVQDLIDETYNR